jgi:hypothetical protein
VEKFLEVKNNTNINIKTTNSLSNTGQAKNKLLTFAVISVIIIYLKIIVIFLMKI